MHVDLPLQNSGRESTRQKVSDAKTQKGTQIIVKRPSSSIRIANARSPLKTPKSPVQPKIISVQQTKPRFEDDLKFSTSRPVSALSTQRSTGNAQFDYLVPLTTDDTSSSIVAYITRYMKMKEGQTYKEPDTIPRLTNTPKDETL